jgi:hypothetical protein
MLRSGLAHLYKMLVGELSSLGETLLGELRGQLQLAKLKTANGLLLIGVKI